MNFPAFFSILCENLFCCVCLLLSCLSLPQVLENEWKKLEASIQETTHNFDETVCKLFERKVTLEMVIYQVCQRTWIVHLSLCAEGMLTILITIFSQEELKIVNLIYSLLLDEELDTREAGLRHFFMKKQKENVNYFKCHS